jgi:VCBS repeat-containing protein
MRASGSVGRVGGLALALGIGAAMVNSVAGLPGIASADDTSASTESAGVDTAATTKSAARAAPRSRVAPAGTPRRTRNNSAPAPASVTRTPKPAVAESAPRTLTPDVVTPTQISVPSATGLQPRPTTVAPTATATPPPVALRATGTQLAPTATVGTAQAVPSPITTSGPGSPADSTIEWSVFAAVRRLGRVDPQPAPAATVTSGQAVRAAATRGFAWRFRNKTPTVSPTQSAQGPTGVITGNLRAADGDGDPLTFSITASPAHGTLTVDASGGFVYTPDKTSAHNGVTDTFSITASDAGAGTHSHGLFAGSRGHTATGRITVTVTPINAAPTGSPSVGSPDAAGVVSGQVTGNDADNDPLTYTGTGATAKGAVVVADNGSFTYTPTAVARHNAASLTATNADKTDSFTVTIGDGHGGSTAVPVSVAIGPANTAPTGSASVGAPNAGTGVVTGSISGADAEADALSYAGSTTTAKGAVSVGNDGSFTYTPTAVARHDAASLTATNADKADSFIVTVSDGHGGTTAMPVTVAISPTNTAPTGSASVGTPNGSTGVVTGRISATDAEGDALGYTGTASTAKGAVIVAGDGSFSYTPTAAARHNAASLTATNADKTDSFAVTVSDGHGGSTAVPVSVAIGPANTAPTGTASSGTPNAATGLVTGQVTGSDPESDAITYTGSATTAKGAVTVAADGSFSYTPTAVARHNAASLTATNADKADTFTITLADGHGGTTAVPVTVAISPANTAPAGSANTATPNPGTGVVTGSITASDPEGDALAYSGSASTAKGSVAVANYGSFTFTPTAAARHNAASLTATNADKTDTFAITVTDGHGGSTAVPVSVAITPANTAPTGTASAGIPNPATGVVTGQVTGSDAESDALTYIGTASTAKGAVIVNSNGSFSYTPTAVARHDASSQTATNADKTDSFTVTITDGHGGSIAVPVSVTVGAFNTAPTGTASVGAPDAGTGVVSGKVTASDAESDALTYGGSASTTKGSVAVASDGTFTYTPTAAARHNASSLTATNADKTDTFAITVTDGHGGSTAVPVSVAITPANTAPTGTANAGTPDPGPGVVTGQVTGSDAESDPLSYTGSATTAKGAVIVNNDGSFTYTPTAAARHAAAAPQATHADKTDAFTITVSDGHGGSIAVPVTVALGPGNTAPTGTASVGTPNPSTGVVTGTVIGTDAEGDPLTYSGTTTTAKGALTVAADGTFTYTPTATARHTASALGATDLDKTDIVTVTISDGFGGNTAVPVTIPISPANTGPQANATVGSPNPGSGVVGGAVNGTDADGDPLSYTGSVTTTKGTAVVSANGTFAYTPTAVARHNAAALTATNADKTDTFTVTVADGHGGSVAVPVSVAISPSNSAPTGSANVGAPDATTGVVAGAILGADAENDPLTYSGSASTAKGTVTVNNDGTFTYTPTALARHIASLSSALAGDKIDSFSVTVADGYGGTVAVPVSVVVSPAAVNFDFSYGSGAQYWTTDARNALQTAAARLSSYLVVDAPVTITYSVTGVNNANSYFLASNYTNFVGSGSGFFGTLVQSEILTGVDPNGATADSQISWNFAYPWGYGDSIRNNQYDLQAVAMHEMMHSLGMLTGVSSPSGVASNTTWTIWDSMLSTADGTKVIGPEYVFNPAYVANLTGGNGGLYFDGAHAVAAYGGPVPVYDPSTFASGSSVSHLDPAYAPAGTTYLMDPSDGYGLGVRALTPVEVGILQDLGYTVYQSGGIAFIFIGFRLRRRR